MQQRQRRSGPRLAIRDPRAVGVVVQPQLHCARSFPQIPSIVVSATVSIGRPVRRREDERILRGRSRFLDDIGLAAWRTWRSCAARTRTRAVAACACRGRARGHRRPTSPAARCPPRVDAPPGLEVADAPHPLLADGEVRYVGQPVAAVVAESRALAEDVAERVEVDYEPLDAGRRPARRARRSCAGSSAAATSPARSPPPRTSSAADYGIPRLAAVPMEPRGALAVAATAACSRCGPRRRAPTARARSSRTSSAAARSRSA